jgi:hypothetical protein
MNEQEFLDEVELVLEMTMRYQLLKNKLIFNRIESR